MTSRNCIILAVTVAVLIPLTLIYFGQVPLSTRQIQRFPFAAPSRHSNDSATDQPQAACLDFHGVKYLVLRNVRVRRMQHQRDKDAPVELTMTSAPSDEFNRTIGSCPTPAGYTFHIGPVDPKLRFEAKKLARLFDQVHMYHNYHGMFFSTGIAPIFVGTDFIKSSIPNDFAGGLVKQHRMLLVRNMHVVAESLLIKELWRMMIGSHDTFHSGRATKEEFVSFPAGTWSFGRESVHRYQEFANFMRQKVVEKCGDVRWEQQLVYEKRERSLADMRYRGIDPELERRLLAVVKPFAPVLHPQTDVKKLSLCEQFHRVYSSSHFLFSEGAFSVLMLLARPGSTFIMVFEHWTQYGNDTGHIHLAYHYPLAMIRRDDIRLIVYLITHPAPLTENLANYSRDLPALLPDVAHLAAVLRGDSGGMNAPGIYHVTTSGIFCSDSQLRVFKVLQKES